MNDLYHPDGETIYLQYLDTNNLCECAMVQKLPTHGFLQKEVEDFIPEKICQKRQERMFKRLMWSIQKSCTKTTTSCNF